MQTADKYKLATGAAILAIFVLLGTILYMQYNIHQKQKEIDQSIIEFKKLEDGVVRLESKYVENNDALEQMLRDLGIDVDVIKKDLNEQGAQLDAVAVVVGTTPGYHGTNLPSDFQTPTVTPSNNNSTSNHSNNNSSNPIDGKTCVSAYGYCLNTQGLNLFEPSEDDQIPFGNVTFNAASDTPWGVNVYPRKYYSVLTFSKNNDGRTIAHAKMMVEAEGKKHTLGINEAYYREVYNPSRFYWWNPRLAGGVGFGVSTNGSASTIASVQFYPSSYASNKARPSWMFFGVGAGYDLSTESFVGTVAPVMYNALPNSNLVQNIYIGPTVGFGTDGAVKFNGSMNIAF